MRHVVALALVVALAGPAQAHVFTPERALVVQLDDVGAALLLSLRVRGKEAKVLTQAYDVNKDGALSEAEQTALAKMLASRGIAGMSVRFGSVTPTLGNVQARLTDFVLDGSRLEATALVELVLPAADLKTQLLVELEPKQPDTRVQVQAVAPWTLSGQVAKAAVPTVVGPLTLSPGKPLTLDIERKR